MAARISLVVPVAGVVTSVPAAEISYISLVSTAELDTTGRYRLEVDSFVTNDGVTVNLTKSLADNASVETESIAKGVDALKSDSFSLTDSILRVLVFIREFHDAYGLSDATAFSVAKLSVDFVTAHESLRRDVSKNLSDSAVLVDLASKSFARTLAETIATTDSQSTLLTAAKSDLIDLADAALHEAQKYLYDAITNPDQVAFEISKQLADGFALNDGADLLDGIVFNATKSVANVAFVDDSAALSVASTYSDSFSLGDFGLIVQQDYCDLTYFAGDYVGSVTTF